MGNERYGYFCVMCHGPKADGDITVGQSFYPLPANLASTYVQKQSDGELFDKIYFGFRGTRSLSIPWQAMTAVSIINYSRPLGKSCYTTYRKNLI
jgi:hypothetical protein